MAWSASATRWPSSVSNRREPVGSLFGILTFLGGVALLGLTFSLAFGMFTQPVETVLELKPGQPLNVNDAGRSVIAMLFRVFLLLVMCLLGSSVANRGIKLYAAGSGQPPQKPKETDSKEEPSEATKLAPEG